MSRKIVTETRKRGLFGKMFKGLFVAFNVIMLVGVGLYWLAMLNHISETPEIAGQAGAFIGTSAVTTIILVFWLLGAGILGALTAATRGKRILVETTA